MAFDPTLPANNAEVRSEELRNQFTGLKDLIDAVPAPPAPQLPVYAAPSGTPGQSDTGPGGDGVSVVLTAGDGGADDPEGNQGVGDGGSLTLKAGAGGYETAAGNQNGKGQGGDVIIQAGAAGGYTGKRDGQIILPTLPTADPGVPGALWNDSGTLKLSAG